MASLLLLSAMVGCGSPSSGDDESGHADARPGTPKSDAHKASGAPDGQLGATSDVTITVEPGDDAAALIASIEGAKKSIHMTMYLLSNKDIINALIAAWNDKLDVKVILDETFPDTTDSNATVYAELMTAKVPVEWASAYYAPNSSTQTGFTHEKAIVLDGTTAWIMTMNATESSPTDNREYLAYDTSAEDVAETEAIFQADWNHIAIEPTGPLLVAPVNARPQLLTLIGQAKSQILIEAEELSDYMVVDALGAAGDKGVSVHIVLSDETPSATQKTEVADLKTHKNISIVSLAKPYVHAKTLAIDGVKSYVGSANFTTGSLEYNRELGLIVTAQDEVDKVVTTTNADFLKGTPE